MFFGERVVIEGDTIAIGDRRFDRTIVHGPALSTCDARKVVPKLSSRGSLGSSEDVMKAITKMLSAALVASVVAAAQPSISLACDNDAQANAEKKKNDKTVAQRDASEGKSKKKSEQPSSEHRERQGSADSSNTARRN